MSVEPVTALKHSLNFVGLMHAARARSSTVSALAQWSSMYSATAWMRSRSSGATARPDVSRRAFVRSTMSPMASNTLPS